MALLIKCEPLMVIWLMDGRRGNFNCSLLEENRKMLRGFHEEDYCANITGRNWYRLPVKNDFSSP